MIVEIYCVYDKAVKAYMPPFYARARGEALRSFTDAVNKEDSNFNKYSLDYILMFLGVFDDGSGTFKSIDPERVISAEEVRLDSNPFPESKRLPM